MFFSFDGLDGVGKSTQMDLFRQWLVELGHDVLMCRDPGSTELGEKIRAILLDSHDLAIGMRAEMLLYMAARAQLVEEVIQPALTQGKTVVSDRFLLSNVVYQGHAGGLNPTDLWQVGGVATAGIRPDVTILLDMPTEKAQERIQRPADRIEQRGEEFRRKLRAGFMAEALADRAGIIVVDAAQEIRQVHDQIRQAVLQRHPSVDRRGGKA